MTTDNNLTGPRPGDLLRRLRAWSLSSWEHGDRIAAVRAAAGSLADLAADAEGVPRREVPALSPMALADQLTVLARDAHRGGAGADADRVLAELAATLGW